MSNLEESQQIQQEISEDKHLSSPIGNKLLDIVLEHPLTRFIDRVMAESFIKNAKNGMLSILLQNNVNFNVGGIYELNYSLLKDIVTEMKAIGADNLVFTFVEVDPKDKMLAMNAVSDGKILYAVASLIKAQQEKSDEHNYLIINAKNGLTLKGLKISNADKEELSHSYTKNSHNILKSYFSINGENTQSIYYHIKDIEDTLDKESGKCDKFKVYLCEISDVEKIILQDSSSLTIDPKVYRDHFKSREKQMTLVFNSEDRYYDMGSLRP